MCDELLVEQEVTLSLSLLLPLPPSPSHILRSPKYLSFPPYYLLKSYYGLTTPDILMLECGTFTQREMNIRYFQAFAKLPRTILNKAIIAK